MNDTPTSQVGHTDVPHEYRTRWWVRTWPLTGRDWLRLALALVAVVGIGVVIGEVLTGWSAVSGVVDLDDEIAQNLADGRTERANDLAHWGAFIADTPVKIALSVAIVGFVLWRFRRWHEAVMIGLPLIFEATAFIVTTWIVGRPRPDVARLLESPVDTSFPSGHVAAATVYSAIVVVVFWHTRSTWRRTVSVGLVAVAPLVVGWARMYQGMHFLTDVIGGIVLGAVSVATVRWIVGRPADTVRHQAVDHHDERPVEPVEPVETVA